MVAIIVIGWIFLLVRGIMLQSKERTKREKNIGIAMIIAFFAIPLIGFSICSIMLSGMSFN